MVAPGDGEAEPGVTDSNFREPAKLATDRNKSMKNLESDLYLSTNCLSPTSWARVRVGSAPQAWLRLRQGLALSAPASQAG